MIQRNGSGHRFWMVKHRVMFIQLTRYAPEDHPMGIGPRLQTWGFNVNLFKNLAKFRLRQGSGLGCSIWIYLMPESSESHVGRITAGISPLQSFESPDSFISLPVFLAVGESTPNPHGLSR